MSNSTKQRDATSDRMKAKFSPYKPRVREPGEAAPRSINTQAKGNEYVPEIDLCARAGSSDHCNCKSHGTPT